nr:DUF1858 domain-containing protein [Nanoarchaeota archaeon]
MAKKQSKSGITKDMLIGDITSKHPKAVELMFKHGLQCVGCGMVAFETLEQGCKAHGMSDKDIDKLVKEMNKAVEKKKK